MSDGGDGSAVMEVDSELEGFRREGDGLRDVWWCWRRSKIFQNVWTSDVARFSLSERNIDDKESTSWDSKAANTIIVRRIRDEIK